MAVIKPNGEFVIDLDGEKGNAFFLLGTAQLLSKQMGLGNEVTEEMQSGDYINLIQTMNKYFPFIIFETNNDEYLEALNA